MTAYAKENETSGDVRIGMGGWEIPSFNGTFYPSRRGKGFRKLEYYSRFFDMVEVNATFYNPSIPPSQSQHWLKDVERNESFIFTVKLFRGFTHTFDATKNDAAAIYRFLDPLRTEKKLAGLVVQFSSSFSVSDSRLEHLKRLRSIFPEDPIFLDLRHKSWDTDSVREFCREYGMNMINVDLPPLPHHVPFNSYSSNGMAYFRMMGRNRETWNGPGQKDRYLYSYTEEELTDLFQRIRKIRADRIYVVFHNDRQPFSIVNGRELGHKLQPEKRFLLPLKFLNNFPQLNSFCTAPEFADDLFDVKK
jgi:uncharacterized protein YecE (DUF72 family)